MLNLMKLTAFLVLSALFLSQGSKADPIADTVLKGADIYTLNDANPWAEAVAIADGQIIYVGSNQGIAPHIDVSTQIIDLDGAMLMPGFHDAHAHVRAGGSSLLGCSLHEATNLKTIRRGLEECASNGSYGPDEWIIGGGWSLAAFPDGAPSAVMLDEIFEGKPAVFIDAFGHNAWASSRALELAGIDAKTPQPTQGVIVRDPDTGAPQGTLRDAAMALVLAVLPEETDEDRYAALVAGTAEANKFGITAFIDPGVTEQGLKDYRTAERRGELTARVVASLSPIGHLAGRFGADIYELLEKRELYRSELTSVDSVKVYIDGVIETRTSYMLEPYLDGSNFPPFYEAQELRALYQRLDNMGIQIHTHAIGDGAIRAALNAYQHAVEKNGPNDNRHQIVHLQLIDNDDIPRFGELNVAANFQCMWCYPDVYFGYAVDIVGKPRVNRFYPVKSVMDSGGLIVGGSDWDVSSLNPLDAIETAVRRQDPFQKAGETLGVNEEITLPEALKMYTSNAAYIMRLEQKTGSIEVGKRADLVALDRNLFKIPTTEINDASVIMTLMDGIIVYSAKAEP